MVDHSWCGKTYLLLKPFYLNFDQLHLYSKSLAQDKYWFLRDWAVAFEEVAGKEVASFHSSVDDIIPVESLNPNERSVIVFEDVMQEKQGPVEKYVTRGRHCFYLKQNYFRVPKQAIRDNAIFIIIFAQDGTKHESYSRLVCRRGHAIRGVTRVLPQVLGSAVWFRGD